MKSIHRLFALGLVSTLSLVPNVSGIPTAAVGGPDSKPESVFFGFERHFENDTAIMKPTQDVLDAQALYNENKYILDSVTNTYILNPEYATTLEKRVSFSPPSGAECRMVAAHAWHIDFSGNNNPIETLDFDVKNNRNTGQIYAHFGLENGDNHDWKYYQLSGHRGWWMQFSYGDNDLFGFNGGWGHIEGKTPDRWMQGGSYCWYASGSAVWGHWGEMSCSSWCSEFNW